MTFKQAIRRLVTAPGFSLLAVATLAIGIGANAAIFSVVDGILLKALPYPDPDRLVAVDHRAPGVKLESAGSAPFLYFTYRDQMKTVQDVGLWRTAAASITGLGDPEQIPTIEVTDGVLPILGVQPAVGRLFTRDDDSPGSPATIVLAYGYWKTRFGGDPSVVGRRILADGQARDIIGVLPASFRFLDRDPSAFLPLRLDRDKTFLGNFSYRSIARLRPGATPEAAATDAARLVPVAIGAFPAFPGFSAKLFQDVHLAPLVRPLKQDIIGDIGRVLWVLMGTIGVVLLIACANVANLLLVRTDGRQQELAIRAALGAGRGRIAKELIVESLVLGVAGGIVGLGLAYAGVRLLVAIAPANLPRLHDIAIDPPVVLFTFVVSLVAGALFGAIPVVKYAGPQIHTALRAGGRTISDSRERHRARNTLVIAQVALALVLLVGSGLMIRTFLALRHVDPGFARPEELLTFRVSIPSAAVKDAVDVVRAQQAIADKIAAVAAVTSVGITTTVPMDGQGRTDAIFAEDRPLAEGQLPPLRRFKFIAPGFLRTMGNRVVAGRDFAWEDLYGQRRVALVSENLARELWTEPQAAIGKRIRDSSSSPWREIVGVVSDERDDGVDHKAPSFVCWPLLMDDFSGDKPSVARTVAFVVRSPRAASSGLLADVGRAVWSVNPNLPLARVRTMQEIYDASLARTSFTLVMLSIAGSMALLLGVAGLYGVISYAVSQRTREIGIRMALGARAGEVTRMFVDQGLRLAAVGILLGLAAAVALTRLMGSLLFDVNPVDPLTYAGVAVGLASAAVLASYVPALRAATVDPADALRAE
ncbi:MAG TPA: ABC transporter permease [Vicinamibacterales bacterium]|nr:ABC transporter permease [Vicinamibacterales bacterium]